MIKNRTVQLIYQKASCALELVGFVAFAAVGYIFFEIDKINFKTLKG